MIAANDGPCLKEFNGTVINHDKLLLTSWSCCYLYNNDYKRVNATQRIEGCARLLFSFGERHLKVKSGKPVTVFARDNPSGHCSHVLAIDYALNIAL